MSGLGWVSVCAVMSGEVGFSAPADGLDVHGCSRLLDLSTSYDCRDL